ncbi:2-phospho-L-lactate guanylyltransferase [Subtercola sp. PAMC28395]|uniref:2-phospho-L-lactate guanylyltransferase n=1 Tax=Subtercola sp. PAMC28395 TaxID=2846775 RepID=UPI001C0E0AA1|nr:2-phospho-L-lactate guanylyltransferase [Subtercola sp. PAMC28395]QWT22763.1 2-phospho-L-lactate guanylyltransferase [Subtercola sp. PAMC28395]
MTGWVVVVPVKGSTESKTRLAAAWTMEAGFSGEQRRELALAFALDAVTAIAAAAEVREVIVVTGDAVAAVALAGLGAILVDDPRAGLNGAITAGIAEARLRHPDAMVAAMTADLPALTTADVEDVLEAAAGHPLAFVADEQGTGTTTITAKPGVTVVPRFGQHSAHAHADSGMVRLVVRSGSTARQDVDTPEDLHRLRGSFGPHTSQLLALQSAPHSG